MANLSADILCFLSFLKSMPLIIHKLHNKVKTSQKAPQGKCLAGLEGYGMDKLLHQKASAAALTRFPRRSAADFLASSRISSLSCTAREPIASSHAAITVS